jgi:hypothetical protein
MIKAFKELVGGEFRGQRHHGLPATLCSGLFAHLLRQLPGLRLVDPNERYFDQLTHHISRTQWASHVRKALPHLTPQTALPTR